MGGGRDGLINGSLWSTGEWMELGDNGGGEGIVTISVRFLRVFSSSGAIAKRLAISQGARRYVYRPPDILLCP